MSNLVQGQKKATGFGSRRCEPTDSRAILASLVTRKLAPLAHREVPGVGKASAGSRVGGRVDRWYRRPLGKIVFLRPAGYGSYRHTIVTGGGCCLRCL